MVGEGRPRGGETMVLLIFGSWGGERGIGVGEGEEMGEEKGEGEKVRLRMKGWIKGRGR